MQKEVADTIITSYLDKIYSFSLSKTMNIDKAEELASRITYEVYKSLLNSEHIHNINGYIYRIASNVYAQLIEEEKKNHEISSRKSESEKLNLTNRDNDYERIRNEISYLSNLQREIVFKYYFQNLKTKEIAIHLGITQAKVKWHLIEARNQIKEGFLENKKSLNNSKNKIFTEMRSIGKLGYIQKYIDMSFYFTKILSQNIAYAAYHKPKTSIEIAKEIAVPVAFVEDEIIKLEENGFLNKLSGNRYITNIYILEQNKEYEDKIHEMFQKYAKFVAEIYVPLILDFVDKNECINNNFYFPQNDRNFLIWSLITFASVNKLIAEDKTVNLSKYMVHRKDGGYNIAHASVPFKSDGKKIQGLAKNNIDLFINSNHPKTYPITIWQFFSAFDNRDGSFTNWVQKLFFLLYDFMKGKIDKDSANIDAFISLYSKGFIVNYKETNNHEITKDYVNLVITTLKQEELINLLPSIPDDLKNIGKEMNLEMYKFTQKFVPDHLKDLCYAMNQNSLRKGLLRVYIIDYLLSTGILKPLKKHQKQTVNMIMFTDVTPPYPPL